MGLAAAVGRAVVMGDAVLGCVVVGGGGVVVGCGGGAVVDRGIVRRDVAGPAGASDVIAVSRQSGAF